MTKYEYKMNNESEGSEPEQIEITHSRSAQKKNDDKYAYPTIDESSKPIPQITKECLKQEMIRERDHLQNILKPKE